MQVAMWLKGVVSFEELYNMPIGEFHYLHSYVINDSSTKEGVDRKSNERAGEQLEEAFRR